MWVDTVGYDDSTNLSDADSFRDVLRYLNDQNLTSVRAVVWTVLPQVYDTPSQYLFSIFFAKIFFWDKI